MIEHADDREEDQPKPASLARLTTDIVAAYAAHNQVATADLGILIGAVANRLRELGRPQEPEPAKLEPAVPVRRSITPDHLVCLVCGKQLSMLKRHLAAEHGLTPGQYREAFGLKSDYPMAAPLLSAALGARETSRSGPAQEGAAPSAAPGGRRAGPVKRGNRRELVT
jgi:predicted transcriptional regulator